MSQQQLDYFVVADTWEVPPGIVLFGHSPNADTPWPRPRELVELIAPNGEAFRVPIVGIEKEASQIRGVDPANRLVLIPPNSVHSLSLKGFRVRALGAQAAAQTSWIKRVAQAFLPTPRRDP